jgi:hypothetical protein
MLELATIVKKAQQEAPKAMKTQQKQALAVHEALAATARRYWEKANFDGEGRPDVRELVGDSVEFNRSLLDANREFGQNILEIGTPRTG